MKKHFLKIAVALTLFSLVILPQLALAVEPAQFGSGYETNLALRKDLDLPNAIVGIINMALGFLGLVAVIIVIFGGFKYMMAMGDSKKIDDAKKLIYAGLIGLIIILAAYAIASFVLGILNNANVT